MIRNDINIRRAGGLNPANSELFVQLACQYSSSIMIRRGSVFINAKSMLGVLSLGAAEGSVITVETEGGDEKKASRAIFAFLVDTQRQ